MTDSSVEEGGYRYRNAELNASHDYLLPVVEQLLDNVSPPLESPQGDNLVRTGSERRIFELGCGNGSVAARISQKGFEVVGVDPSAEGIGQGLEAFPGLRLHHGSCYDDLAAVHGRFPIVLSLEVVEHVYDPRSFARTVFHLLEPGGTAILSTPYHGYWKNLALAVSGHMDAHFTALWDHGHIKFWSFKTLGELLREAGFDGIRFLRVGRIPPLAKSMIAVCKRP